MRFLIGAKGMETRGGFPGRAWRTPQGLEPFTIGETAVLGVRYRRLTVEVPVVVNPSQAERSGIGRAIAAAAARMRSERAGSVIFAEDFGYKELFAREGFVEAGSDALKAALAGRIAVRAAEGRSCAALFAHDLTAAAARTLQELCRTFRLVIAATDTGGASVLETLRRRTGVSILSCPTDAQLRRTDVAVFYAASEGVGSPGWNIELPEACTAVEAADGALEGVLYRRAVTGLSLRLADGRDAGLPAGFPELLLLSAALEAGTLASEDLVLREISFSANTRV